MMRFLLLLAVVWISSCSRTAPTQPDPDLDSTEELEAWVLEQLQTERQLQKSQAVENWLVGGDLYEYYFVWSFLHDLHPSGGDLQQWWRYPGIEEALDVVRQAYPDPFSFYLQPALAKILLEEHEMTVDTTVFLEWPLDSVALIQVTEFREHSIGTETGDTTGTWSEFRRALQKSDKAAATVLDLRGNPGGAVSICTAIADELVDSGVLFIEVDHWAKIDPTVEWIDQIRATPGGLGVGRRWVVLQDSLSASCSELLLIALKGNEVGRAIGSRSYGKGIGQSYLVTPYDGLLAVTSLEFFSNDSSSYHFWGIEPDSSLFERDAQLSLALEWATGERVLTAPQLEAGEAIQQRLSERAARISRKNRPFYRFRLPPSPRF